MTPLFFQDCFGVLDVFQMCLIVFSPFSPGVHGRNWHFLELGDSLPGGGYQPARILCVESVLIPLSSAPSGIGEGCSPVDAGGA